MFTSNNPFPKRKPSQTTRKRSIRTLVNRVKPGLAVDTSFSRHYGHVPQQVFPYESKTQELSFVSNVDARPLERDQKTGLKQQLENRLPTRRDAVRSVSEDASQDAHASPSRPMIARGQTGTVVPTVADDHPRQTGLQSPLLHKRIKGLRPSPLNLTLDVSPSDRAITIGIAMPSATVSDPMSSPQSVAPRPHSPSRTQQTQKCDRAVVTPTIVITPAKEDFDFGQPPEELRHVSGDRPASSVYSRYTNCYSNPLGNSTTPPVPPLPLFVSEQHRQRDAWTTVKALSVCTAFEEDNMPSRRSKRLTSQSHLPTPLRSRGWWNVITSPFSVTSGTKSNSVFWRSPSGQRDHTGLEETEAILTNPSEMGYADSHTGLVFTNRAVGDEELRSALPFDTNVARPPMPRRSDTAPSALGADVEDEVNIYWIPSQGLAAPYYDVARRFPSLILGGEFQKDVDDLRGWSPSQSVFRAEESPAEIKYEIEQQDSDVEHVEIDEKIGHAQDGLDKEPSVAAEENSAQDTDEGPFADVHTASSPDASHVAPLVTHSRGIFSSPSEYELKGATPPRPANDRSNTEATVESHFSPLTPTPVVEHARVATFMGPQSSYGESREVELAPVRSLTPPSGEEPALDEATVAHHGTGRDVPAQSRNENVFSQSNLHSHVRSDSAGSCGLGISTGETEKALFPPQKHTRQQPRLGTDRFGQLTIRGSTQNDSNRPWYRRLFWLLIMTVICLVAISIISLVTFTSQSHDDMAVQAQWLNLTGFPPMPTGISTVVPGRAKEVTACVSPQNMWNCEASTTEGGAGQPDFRFEIRFRNGTLPQNETELAKRSGSGATQASALIRRTAVMKRTWTESLFAANPSTPSKEDQLFIGNTTDDIRSPFDGDETPFYVSLLDASALVASNLHKRQSQGVYPYPTASFSRNSTASSPNATTKAPANVPRPTLRENGEPAPPELYPLAQAQSLRLYNRGLDDEHYGFYTYFDRSIYVTNSSSDNGENLSSNTPLDNSSAVCTWSQTRFHIQIWTRKTAVASLSDPIPLSGLPAANSTANQLNRPGSFPYPVTVTLDRHGGDAKHKGLYCYGLNDEKQVIESSQMWVNENRAFAGTLINAAAVPYANNGSTTLIRRDGTSAGQASGGVDGGSGGCSCAWRNWA